jgi:hypothetical protein
MPTVIQRRRGTTAQTAVFTGALAELTVDTDKKTVVVHDGSTAGGFPVATMGVVQTFTKSQRGASTTDNDLSFDMSVTNHFTCTPTAGGTLTFTNIAAGQSGYILLVNNSNYVISAAATTKIVASELGRISNTGTYLIAYYSNGTNVYCTVSGNVA